MTDKTPEAARTSAAKAGKPATAQPTYNSEYLHKLWNSGAYPSSLRDSFDMPEATRLAAKVHDIPEERVRPEYFRLRYPTTPGTQAYLDQLIIHALAPLPAPPMDQNNVLRENTYSWFKKDWDLPYYWRDRTRYLQERWEPQYYIPKGLTHESPTGFTLAEMSLQLLRVAPDYAQLSRNLNNPSAPALTSEERDQWLYRVQNYGMLPTYNWWKLTPQQRNSDRRWIISNEGNTGHMTASVAIPGHALSEPGVPYAATVRIQNLRFDTKQLDQVRFGEGVFQDFTDKLIRIEALTQYLHMAQMAPAMLLSAGERREYEQALGLPLEQAELHQRLEVPRKQGLVLQEALAGINQTHYWTAASVDSETRDQYPMFFQPTYPAQHALYRYQRLESSARHRMGPDAVVPGSLIGGVGKTALDQGRPLYLQRTDAQWENAQKNSQKEAISAGAGLATPLNHGLAHLGLGTLSYLSPARKMRYENVDSIYLLTKEPLLYPQDLPSMRLAAGRDRLMSDYTEVLTKATIAQDPRYRIYRSASSFLKQTHPQEDKSAARLDIVSLCPPDEQGRRRVMPLGSSTQDVRQMMLDAQQAELLELWEEMQALKDRNMALRKTFHAVVLDAYNAQKDQTQTSPESVTRGKRLSRLSETAEESSARLRAALYHQMALQRPAHAPGRDLRDMVRTARFAPHDKLVAPLQNSDSQKSAEFQQTLLQLHEALAARYGTYEQRKKATTAIRERVTGAQGEVREFAKQRKADTWDAVTIYREQLRNYAMQAMPGFHDLPDSEQAQQIVWSKDEAFKWHQRLGYDYPGLWPKGPWANLDALNKARETFPPTVRDDVPVMAPPSLEPRPPSGKIQPHMGDRLSQVQGLLEYLNTVTGKPELEVFQALQKVASSALHSPDMAPYKDVHVIAEAAAQLTSNADPKLRSQALPAEAPLFNLPKGKP